MRKDTTKVTTDTINIIDYIQPAIYAGCFIRKIAGLVDKSCKIVYYIKVVLIKMNF